MNNALAADIELLNPQQRAVIDGFKGPSLIVAGPGTGKTRTVSILIGKLLEQGLRFKEILALTFSDRAARELSERVFGYFPQSFDECWISTFHSFCARILREQFDLVGIDPAFRLLTGFKEALLMSGICRRQDPAAFPVYGKVIAGRGFQLEVLTFIGLLKSNLVLPSDLEQMLSIKTPDGSLRIDDRTRPRLSELLSLYNCYEHERVRTGYLDFRDLIRLTIEALRHPGVAAIYREKFRCILVDEFQDTDPAQFLLLSLLTGDQPRPRVAVIGDPRQSIYRFRGADPGMMTPQGLFQSRFHARIFPLETNYRCASVVLQAARRLHWTTTFETPGTGSPVSRPLPKAPRATSAETSNPVQPPKEPFRWGFAESHAARDELGEARLIARRIASLLIYGQPRPDGTIRRYSASEIAILVRNNYQIDLISESLRALNLPFAIGGDMKFFRSEEVSALASLMQAVSLPEPVAGEALKRAFCSPAFRLDPLWTQAVLAGLPPGKPLLVWLSAFSQTPLPESSSRQIDETNEEPGSPADCPPCLDPETLPRAKAFAATIDLLRSGSGSLAAATARLLFVARDWITDPTSPTARSIFRFRAFLADFDELFQRQMGRPAALSDLMPEFDAWLTYYASTIEESDLEAAPTGIQLMTIHQSKGLEFPVVIIPGLCENQFPVAVRTNLLLGQKGLTALQAAADGLQRIIPFFNPYPSGRAEHLEEERRLFFVAVTRAKEGLVLSHPQRVGGEPGLPAPFLAEVGIPIRTDWEESRVLSIGELRIRLAELAPERHQELQPVLATLEEAVGPSYLVEPRVFVAPAITPLPPALTIPRFSAHSLRDFLDCPRRYYFKHILRISDEPATPSPARLAGNAFHAVLEAIHRPGNPWENGRQPTDEELEALWKLHAEPLLAELPRYEQLGIAHRAREIFFDYRQAVYHHGQFPASGTRAVEGAFDFSLRGFPCTGRWDRLVAVPDGFWVLDYKTGSTKKTPAKMMEAAFPAEGAPQEIQLPFYLLAMRELGLFPASAMTVYLEGGLYKKKTGGFNPGFLRSAPLNAGTGPAFGEEIEPGALDSFAERMVEVMTRISGTRVFDCAPSREPNANSCMSPGFGPQRGCGFKSLCQARLDELHLSPTLGDESEPEGTDA